MVQHLRFLPPQYCITQYLALRPRELHLFAPHSQSWLLRADKNSCEGSRSGCVISWHVVSFADFAICWSFVHAFGRNARLYIASGLNPEYAAFHCEGFERTLNTQIPTQSINKKTPKHQAPSCHGLQLGCS